MNHNIIISSRREDPFARVPKSVLDDEHLSWKAKGILSYLLGKPPGWKVRVNDLVKHSTDGEAAVRSALKELRQLGYAKLEKEREGGRIMGWVWQISDTPMFPPYSPDRDFQDVENHHISKNDLTKNDLSKGSKVTCSSARTSIPATWKPDTRSRWEKLEAAPPPDEYQSEQDFDFWVGNEAPSVANYRPDLYHALCENKWRHWDEENKKWVRIRDWKAYVLGLERTILDSLGGSQ